MKFFKHLQWKFEYAAYRTMEWIFSRLSPGQISGLGRTIGQISYHFFPARRRIVTRNLRLAFGEEMDLDEIDTLTRDVFARGGANIFSSVRSANFTIEELQQHLDFPDLAEFKRLTRSNEGVIFLIPHMGNWEILSQSIRYFSAGEQLATHYRKLHNPYLNARIEAQRSHHGIRLISKDDSPHTMAALLRDGGALGILADQRAGNVGYWCSYYGQHTSCSPLPELLARRTGAAIACLSIETTESGHWRARIDQVPHKTTPACMAAIEEATRRSPSDVFWFQARWKIDRTNPFGIKGRIHREVDLTVEDKPLRLLIWISSTEDALPALPAEPRAQLNLEIAYPEGTTPPSYPDFPWARTWPCDSSIQPEQIDHILRSIDDADPVPLGCFITTVPCRNLLNACHRTGLTHSLDGKKYTD